MERRDNRRKVDWRRRPSRRERERERLLRDWFGASRAPEEILQRHPPARPIGDDIVRFLAKGDSGERALLDRLRRDWRQIAGPDIAKYTQAYSLREGTLLVEVAHPAWLYVLEREHKPVLTERIQRAAEGRVREIRLIQKGRRASRNSGSNRGGRDGSKNAG